MKKILKSIVPGLLLVTLATPGFAENRQGAGTLSPFVGGYVMDPLQQEKNGAIVGLRAGYNFTGNLGAEAMFGYSLTETKPAYGSRDTDIYRYGVDILYHFMPENNLVPFIAVGGGGISFDTPSGPNAKNYYSGVVDYGAGLKYFVAPDVALRGDVRHVLIIEDTNSNNLEYSVGLTFQFGGKEKPAPVLALAADSDGDGVPDTFDNCSGTPAGVAVGRDGCPPDADKDGVPDYQDTCSGTPAGAAVDKNGCPLDADRDGVADYLDKCPGTPAGVTVGADGCPLDADRDGVPDSLDKCSNTPAGAAVGTDGCLLDADMDGVPDYLDKCPNTPAGVTVGTDGCPLDSDRDGVSDYLDTCPNTPAGVKVDAKGCPEVAAAPVVVPVVVLVEKKAEAARRFCSKPAVLAINFDTNKAVIKPQYRDELKSVGDFLTYFPNAKGEISGHADNVGSREFNQKLSQARADSVKKYIDETFGIESARVTSKGYGVSKPVASNKTRAGQAQNRRIVANFTCE